MVFHNKFIHSVHGRTNRGSWTADRAGNATIKFTLSKVTSTFPLYSLYELRTEGRRTARQTRRSQSSRRHSHAALKKPKKHTMNIQKLDNVPATYTHAHGHYVCVCVCSCSSFTYISPCISYRL